MRYALRLRRPAGVVGLLILCGLAVAACGSAGGSALSSTTTSTSTTTTTSGPSVQSFGSQYDEAIAPMNSEIAQWKSAYANLTSGPEGASVMVTQPQIAAIEDPMISALGTAINQLSDLSAPASIKEDLRSEISAMAAFQGDLRGLVNSWPDAQSEVTQGGSDLAQLNSATALVHSDLQQGTG